MVHWVFILGAFLAGVIAGIFFAALMAAGSKRDGDDE